MNQLDEAELRLEMRNIYKELGYTEALSCLLELLLSATILCEVIDEERKREEKEGLDA